MLALDGPDALPFAQAQFANDVTALVIGQWQWSAWLTPKGRVVAMFALLRTGETSLRLLLPDHDAGELAEALRRFVFRRKVTITVRHELVVSGAHAVPEHAAGNRLDGDEAGGIELDYGTPALPRTLRIAPAPASASAADAEAWRVDDLRLGLPRLVDGQREQWTPQQLGLDRLQAFSVRKGCYPGQEIVARTHFLGKAKRELVLLQVGDGVQPGTEVRQDETQVGTVACVAGRAPRLALAVLNLERGQAPLRAGDGEAHQQPLLDGFGR